MGNLRRIQKNRITIKPFTANSFKGFRRQLKVIETITK
jgi:hypothetical protein